MRSSWKTCATRYLARIRELLAHFAGSRRGQPGDRLAAARRRRRLPAATAAVRQRRVRASRASRSTGNLDSHYTFDNFVEGRSNQLGRAAAWQAAQKPGDRAHNPLLLYGGTGLGKTHLMFAAGNAMRAQTPGMRVHVPALGTVHERLHARRSTTRPAAAWTRSSASSSRSMRC